VCIVSLSNWLGLWRPRPRQRVLTVSARRRTLGSARRWRNCEWLEDRRLLSIVPPSVTYAAHATFQDAGAPSLPASAIEDDALQPGAAGLTPDEIRNAYGVSSMPTIGGGVVDGAGQTIAIVDWGDNPTVFSDVDLFDYNYSVNANGNYYNLYARYGDSHSFLSVVNQSGQSSPLPASGNGFEIALDVEWAHVIAPAAKILLVEANSATITEYHNAPSVADAYTAVDTARNNAAVSVVSMSWGFPEYSSEVYDDFHFTTPAGHRGVTFLAATGDSGVPAAYPAFSPNVVAVGGTQLSTYSNGTWLAETGWSLGGGGQSLYESEPLDQGPVQHSNKRETPDVSANAGTAMSVFYNGSWWTGTGTSFAAPMWSGLIALADEERAIENMPTLDGPTEALPRLYSTPTSDYHDIMGGNNGLPAGSGYDEVTGIGSPIASSLVPTFRTLLTPTTGQFVSGAQVALVIDIAQPSYEDLFTVGSNGLVLEDQVNESTHQYYGQYVIDPSTIFSAATNITAYSDGTTLNLFAVGTDGHIKWAQQAPNGRWTSFTTVDAGFVYEPGQRLVGQSQYGTFSLFAIGTDGYLRESQFASSTDRWLNVTFAHALQFNPGTPLSIWYNNNSMIVDLYGELPNGNVGQWQYVPSSGWSGGTIAAGGALLPVTSGPGVPLAVSQANSWIDVFGVNSNGDIGQVQLNGGGWNGGDVIPAGGASFAVGTPIVVAEYSNGIVQIFGANKNGNIGMAQYAGGTWAAGYLAANPSFVPDSGVTYYLTPSNTVQVLGFGTNGHFLEYEDYIAWTEYDLH
jgi:hypothetical protein